jgi:hypothetical protein
MAMVIIEIRRRSPTVMKVISMKSKKAHLYSDPV